MGTNNLSRADRHAQTPLVKGVIRKLRELIPPEDPKEIADALTINTISAFALELSLKLIYMTFHEAPPPSTHKLFGLWKGLPPEWQSDIDTNYRAHAGNCGTIPIFAIQRSALSPEKPQKGTGVNLQTAERFFDELSNEFIRSRYFFETVEVGNWSFVFCPRQPMLLMLDILAGLYDNLLAPKASE